MLDWVLDGHVVNPRRLHVQVVQQSVGGKLREGVVDDPGDQLGQLPGDLRSDLLYNLLAVIIEKFIDGVSQQFVLTIEKVVQLDVNVTYSEVNVKVGDLQELSSFRIYNGVDEREREDQHFYPNQECLDMKILHSQLGTFQQIFIIMNLFYGLYFSDNFSFLLFFLLGRYVIKIL